MKKCSKCKIEKELSEFRSIKRKNKIGLVANCKSCEAEYAADRYKNKKEEISEYQSQHYQKNKRKIQDRNNKTRRIRREDPLYKLKEYVNDRMRRFLKGKNVSINVMNVIDCSYEEFKKHLEDQFEDWMSWDNWGKYNGELNFGWDIDHIIPVSSAKTEEELIKLNRYTNLQPLCSKINRDIKKDKINYEITKNDF